MDFGIFTFGELSRNSNTGAALSPQQRLKEIIELAKLADQAGLGFLGLGEHHRRDFALSAPEIVLAAIARETSNLRLGTAVTVLSTQDPVRLFEQFATLDLISDGRAEIIAGRGAFVESYPLFGHNLDDYDALFDEKLRLLLELRDNARDNSTVQWSGTLTQSIPGMDIAPRPVQQKLPVWVGVRRHTGELFPGGQARASSFHRPVVRAGHGFRRLVELYRESAAAAGHDAGALPWGPAATSTRRRRRSRPATRFTLTTGLTSSKTCPTRRPLSPVHLRFLDRTGRRVAGREPATDHREAPGDPPDLGNTRYLAQIGLGGLPFAETARSIELLATEIMPAVNREVSAGR